MMSYSQTSRLMIHLILREEVLEEGNIMEVLYDVAANHLG